MSVKVDQLTLEDVEAIKQSICHIRRINPCAQIVLLACKEKDSAPSRLLAQDANVKWYKNIAHFQSFLCNIGVEGVSRSRQQYILEREITHIPAQTMQLTIAHFILYGTFEVDVKRLRAASAKSPTSPTQAVELLQKRGIALSHLSDFLGDRLHEKIHLATVELFAFVARVFEFSQLGERKKELLTVVEYMLKPSSQIDLRLLAENWIDQLYQSHLDSTNTQATLPTFLSVLGALFPSMKEIPAPILDNKKSATRIATEKLLQAIFA